MGMHDILDNTKKKECIEAYLAENAQINPGKPAVIVKETVTAYGKFWMLVRGMASYLSEQCGVKRGECVVGKASQTLEYAITYFAVHLAGAVFVPLEKSQSADSCLEIIKETEARVYISNNAIEDGGLINIRMRDVKFIAEESFDEGKTFCFPSGEDSADIMYTTGTTGKAKGVEVTHSVLLATAENYIYGFEIRPDNVIAVPGPMNHVNALRKLYVSIMNGSTIVIINGLLSMKEFFNALDFHGVTSLCLPPASLRTIWHLTKDKLGDYADQIDFVEVSTAPVTEKDKEMLRRQLPHSRLYNNYGLSECGAMVMYDFNRYPNQAHGCVGKPAINSHVIIVDDERKEIRSSKDHVGLIANSGPINMKGYWKQPELTSQTKSDGFVYTNDIAYFDEDGFLYVIGRKNDTINVGGLKVAPTDIEEAAMLMGSIEECICVPANDEMTGDAIKLFVVMRENEKFDAGSIIQFLSGKLMSYQMPRIIEQIDRIPKNYVGKPDRKAFKDGILDL